MPKSVNKVILIGNLGQDPDIKYTPSGKAVAKFSVATNERFKDKTGEWQDRVEWHNVLAWQRLAEIVGEYLRKGTKVYIEGRLQTRTWEDRHSGDNKYRTEIVVRDLVLLRNGNGSTSEDLAGFSRPNRRGDYDRPPGEDVDFDRSNQVSDDDIPF